MAVRLFLACVVLSSTLSCKSHKYSTGDCFRVYLKQTDATPFQLLDIKIVEMRGHTYLYDRIDYLDSHPKPLWGRITLSKDFEEFDREMSSDEFSDPGKGKGHVRQPDCDLYEDGLRMYRRAIGN